MTNVIIIGAGMGGCSAALWCKRLELGFTWLEQGPAIGGQLAHVYNPIPDYPGRLAADGAELRAHLQAHLDAEGLAPTLGAAVVEADLAERCVTLADGTVHRGRAIVLATGVERRRLGVPGEVELTGRGVGGSGRRDRAAYADQAVVVVGGGDSACENALLLAETCRRVTLVHRRGTFRARPAILEAVLRHPRIQVLTDTRVKAVLGTEWLEGLRVDGPGGEQVVVATGLFVRIGYQPVTHLFQRQVRCDPDGYIQVDGNQRTTLPGVYAVGDVCNPVYASLAVAAGQGMIAIKAAARELASE
jgi:thioredoxin reductase (NADPH)